MNYVFVRRVAVVVIIAFTFMVISPQYSFSQNRGIRGDLEAARLLYENGNYDEAQVKIKSVVDKIGDNKQYIEELCTAYYLRAKIRFELDEKNEMKEALKKLYQTNLHFNMPQNEDAEFLKIAYEEREKVRAEAPPKPEPVIIEINSTFPESVKVCVDKLDLDQAKPFSKNGIELDIKPGKHVFYFISDNKCLKEERVVKTGDILDFNLDFSKAQYLKDGNIIAKNGKISKKKFPWLVVVAGVVVAGVVVYLLTAKKAKKTLTVEVGEGVSGNPASGTYTHKKGASVSYNYTAQGGYASVAVTLDGAPVDASGTIKMDKDHTLSAKATKEFTLTVTRGEGVDGTPESGVVNYKDGETVNYNYTLQDGYRNLTVTLDGKAVAASGSIIMDKHHVLIASAGKGFSLAVTKGDGVEGTPDGGTSYYSPGTTVNYNYTLKAGYKNLVVMLDSIVVPASGTVTMDKDHTLVALSDKEWTLTVTKGNGVDGIPIAGIFTYKEGETVTYEYKLQTGYRDLVVTLDGVSVPASGAITMTKNCALNATATREYTLTVVKGDGVNGTPDTGNYKYKEGDKVPYSYSLLTGYSDLNVIIDGSAVAAGGTITMDKDHTLVATSGKTFILTVTKGTGVDGTPESGALIKKDGETVPYSYTAQEGYTGLIVTLDGNAVAASGTITMTKNCTLSASATAIPKYTLTVTKETGVNGTPNSGPFEYEEGKKVDYSYSLQAGYRDLVVMVDTKIVPATGTITMKTNHALSASATKEWTLTVTQGTGVNGTPASGTLKYAEGASVPYSYTLQAGYKTLTVTLDGSPVGASGAITMNGNHTLIASATAIPQYTLTVTRGTGVDGTPVTGTTPYSEGASVSYSYSLQAGYKTLTVTLDGNSAPASGTITMNGNRTLIASATAIPQYTLTVSLGVGVGGTPNTTTAYPEGTSVSYNYTEQPGYKDLVVTLDGNPAPASGTITMNGNHTLSASATAIPEYTLTVTIGTGVDGTPVAGTTNHLEGAIVPYSYTLQAGYTSLAVTLDGNPLATASGDITMDANHTLVVSATPE